MFKINKVFLVSAVIVAALSLLHMFIALGKGVNIYDEGLLVYGAERILTGDLPYRDFWTLYAPGQFCLLASLFRFFGVSLFVERVFSVIVLIAISIAVYFITAKIQNRRSALLAFILSLIWLSSFTFYASPVPVALLLSLSSCFFFMRFVERQKIYDLLLSSLFAGIVVVFRHDLGFFLLVGEAVLLVMFSVFRLKQVPVPLSKEMRYLLVSLGVFAGGCLIVLGPVVISFVSKVPIKTLLNDLIVFPLTIFPEVRALPYPAPGMQTMVFYFVPLVFVFIAVRLVSGLLRKEISLNDRKTWNMFLFLLVGMMFLSHAKVRSDLPHLLPSIIPATILFAVFVDRFCEELTDKSRPSPARINVVLSIFLSCIALLTFLKPFAEQCFSFFDKNKPSYSMTLKRGVGIKLRQEDALYEDIIKYVQDRVPGDEKIFVGNIRHDNIPMSDVMFYFLSERSAVSRYHELHPGVATEQWAQEEIIAGLEKYKVNYIVLVSFADDCPGGAGSNVLDLYIRKNFAVEKDFGGYQVWKRN